MGKRKVITRSSKQKDKTIVSQSDSETDLELPLKRIRTRQSSKLELSSTPNDKHSTAIDVESNVSCSENEMLEEESNLIEKENCYGDFSSFLKSYSFNSDNEDEKEPSSQKLEKDKNKFRASNASPIQSKLGSSVITCPDDSIDYSEEDIRVISVPHKQLEIVLLQHPATLTLHGHLKVTAVFGSMSIHGYNLKEGKHVKVFSTRRAGFQRVSTLKSMHQLTKEALHKKLCKLNGDDMTDFMNEVGPASVVVLLEQCLLQPQLQLLELYYPQALEVNDLGKKNKKTKCSMKEMNAINIHNDDEVVAEAVSQAIIDSKKVESGLSVMVSGPKQAGKSSLLQYLTNTVLNNHPAVYYLDTDPGQTEFTPPAVVSITKITKPLLGPPFSHQRKPVRMVFTGSSTAATSPDLYLKSVISLIKFYKAKFPKEILFVNTMGWLQGLGEYCLREIKDALNPSLIIELCPSEECPEMNLDTIGNKTSRLQVPIKDHLDAHPFSAKELRNFSLLSYFGRCQKYYMQPTYINAMRPFRVCWDKIAIYIMSKKIPSCKLVEAMNCSVVGLCRVKDSFFLKSEGPDPMTISEDTINECIGFGIVRATDQANHLLYIVSPLPLEELSKVNAIIKGNVIIPEEVYLKQPVSQVPLPYTDRSRFAPSFARRTVKKRSFRKSIVQTPPAQL